MVEPDGVVLTRRAIPPCQGLWHLPGATVRFGEALEDTARRVAREETGVEVKGLEQLGIVEYVFPDYAHRPVSVLYLAQPVSRRYCCDQNATDVRAFRVPDEIVEVDAIPQHRGFLLEHAEVIRRRVRAASAAG